MSSADQESLNLPQIDDSDANSDASSGQYQLRKRQAAQYIEQAYPDDENEPTFVVHSSDSSAISSSDDEEDGFVQSTATVVSQKSSGKVKGKMDEQWIIGQAYNPQVSEFLSRQSTLPGPIKRWDFSHAFGTSKVQTVALHYFETLWTQKTWQRILDTSNEYAQVKKKLKDFTHITMRELKAYVGIVLYMGIVQLPKIADYWSTHQRMSIGYVRDVMSRNRFQEIASVVSLRTDLKERYLAKFKRDPMQKVGWLVTELNEQFKNNWNIHDRASIDEAMIPYTGRLHFKQYMKDKPTKWGIKVFVLADSVVPYVVQFKIYTGKGGEYGTGLSSGVVLDLISKIRTKNVKLYMDNYYTSTELFRALLDKKVYACGTFQKNRKGFPKEMAKQVEKMERGGFLWAVSNGLMATSWKDKKVVTALTNFHKSGEATPVRRYDKKGKPLELQRPAIIQDYNQYMNGVDRIDQMRSYYSCGARSKRWWIPVFYWLLDMTVINSFQMFNYELNSGTSEEAASNVTQLQFRLTLIEELIADQKVRQLLLASDKFFVQSYRSNAPKRSVKNQLQVPQATPAPQNATAFGQASSAKRAKGQLRFPDAGKWHLPVKDDTIQKVPYCCMEGCQNRRKILCDKCPGKVYLCELHFRDYHEKLLW
ncbi:hypothetical protein MP228_002159 [Amoeboaphelidium protococcarum]|nr:hypothetical protein MP228_002159 [Amoeboaphelidium protococcarum]